MKIFLLASQNLIKILILLMTIKLSNCLPPRAQLRKKLLENYDPTLIPTTYDPNTKIETALEISMEVSMVSLQFVDTQEGSFKFNGWLTYIWKDERLKWDQTEYNITRVTFSSDTQATDAIWIPDIYPYKTVDAPLSTTTLSRVFVLPDGTCYWNVPGSFSFTQQYNLKNYPNDSQVLYFAFLSWSYKEDIMVIKPADELVYKRFEKNLEWTIKSTKVEKYPEKINVTKYSQILFEIAIKRNNSSFYTSIIYPAICMTILLIGTFFIPPDSGERLGYAMTLMLTLVVFLTMINEYMPITNQGSFIEDLFGTLFLFSVLIASNVIFMAWLHKNEERVVYYLKFFTILCRIRKQKIIARKSLGIIEKNLAMKKTYGNAKICYQI